MPTIDLQIATRRLAGGAYLAEAIGSAEVSALGSNADPAAELLRRKLTGFFSEEELAATLTLHRRRLAGKIHIGETEVRVTAPRRSTAWEQPVRIHVHFVHWQEREDLCVAYVPQFQVMVF